jgi:hypothetical protein
MNSTAPLATVGTAVIWLCTLDLTIETMRSGSRLRWWVAAKAIASLAVFLSLLAVSAWTGAGPGAGLAAFGQSGDRLLAALVAAGTAFAGLALVRARRLPSAARWGLGALAAYGTCAFVLAAVDLTPIPALLSGRSLFQRLPVMLQGAFLGGLVVLPLGALASFISSGLIRPREGSSRADAARLVAIVTSVATVAAGIPLPAKLGGGSPGMIVSRWAGQDDAGQAGPQRTPAEMDRALTNSLRAVEDGDRDAARDRWDPAWVASRLGRDPQRVFEWVRGNTAWIPYRGVLRGPVGVLMDRRGNGLDRALLLAALMRESNRQVRLAHGQLSRDRASKLVPALTIGRIRLYQPTGGQRRDELRAVAAKYQLDEPSIRSTLARQADERIAAVARLQAELPKQVERLAAAVGPRQRDSNRAALGAMVDALTDHWWVQVREGSAWRDFDLLGTPDGTPVVAVSETREFDGLPPDLLHEVVVRVVAEQWSSGSLTERVALERALQPAKLIGVPVHLQLSPRGWPKQFPPAGMDARQGLRAFALEQHEWVPALGIGGETVTQSAIRDSGDLGRAGGEDPMAPTGRETGGAAGGVADLFKSAPSEPGPTPPAPSGRLTAVWIEYEIRAPGEQPEKIRRQVFDAIGPSARAARPVAEPKLDQAGQVARSLAMMMDTEILPLGCRIAPQFVTHLASQGLLANREVLATMSRANTADDFAKAQDIAKRLAPMPTPLYDLALTRFDWSRFGAFLYLDRPNILTRHLFLAPRSNGFVLQRATDIVAHELGVDWIAGDGFNIRLEQGVVDTNAEALLASNRPDASSAAWAFQTGGEWVTLTSRGDTRLDSLRLGDDVRARIAADLSAGLVVVAPKEPVKVGDREFIGWWRVDPATGDALGMGSTGWGQSMPEWAFLVLAGAAVSFLFAYLLCRMTEDSNDVMAACDPALRGPRLTALDLFVTPVQAAGTACWKDGLVAFFLGGILAGLGASMGAGANEPGAGPGEPGGDPFADTQPDLGATQPDLGNTMPGGARGGTGAGAGGGSGGAGGTPPAGAGGQSGGSSGGAGNNPEWEAAREGAERRYWDALERDDQDGIYEAIRDMIRTHPDVSPDFKSQLAPPGTGRGTWVSKTGGSPKPEENIWRVVPSPGSPRDTVVSPPPCPQPDCGMSPLAKSVGGLGGVVDTITQVKK